MGYKVMELYISIILLFIGNIMIFYGVDLAGVKVMGTPKGAVILAVGVVIMVIGLFLLLQHDPKSMNLLKKNWRFTI